MDSSDKIVKNRKFHDAWAFILYAILTSVIYWIMFYNHKENFPTLSMSNVDINYELVAASFGYIFGFIALTTLMLRFFTKFTLHFSFFGMNSIFLILMLYSGTKLDLAIYFGIYWALSLVAYFCWGYYCIPFTAVILKDALRIFMRYFAEILFIGCVSMLVFMCNFVAIFIFFENYQGDSILLFLAIFLHYFWTQCNTMYFFTVFASSITGIHVLSLGKPKYVFFRSLKNTILALGSICVGGLLVALVRVLKLLVRDNYRHGRGRGDGLALVIIKLICLLFLYFLEDIVAALNDWAFAYLAIYGKSFKNSLSSSLEIISQNKNVPLMASFCINMASSLLAISGIIGFAMMLGLLFKPEKFYVLKKGVRYTTTKTDTDFILLVVFVMSFIINFCEIFGAMSKSIMFLYSEYPDEVQKTLPHSGEELGKKVSE